MSLSDYFNLLVSAEEFVFQIPHELGSELKIKFDSILINNPDLGNIRNLYRMMNLLQSSNKDFFRLLKWCCQKRGKS